MHAEYRFLIFTYRSGIGMIILKLSRFIYIFPSNCKWSSIIQCVFCTRTMLVTMSESRYSVEVALYV